MSYTNKASGAKKPKDPLLDMALRFQMGCWAHFAAAYEGAYGIESKTVASGISNYIFHFGNLGKRITADTEATERVLTVIADPQGRVEEAAVFGDNALGLIASAAALRIPVDQFRGHVGDLWRKRLISKPPGTMAGAAQPYFRILLEEIEGKPN